MNSPRAPFPGPSSAGTSDHPEVTFNFDEAMRRLVYLMLFGLGVLLLYPACLDCSYFLAASVITLVAAATMVVAGLIGFLFGVPYVRSPDTHPTDPKTPAATPDANSAPAQDLSYRPNTSLEQLSDWLTKMLVGVSLVELTTLKRHLHRLIDYLAPALGDDERAHVIALSILLFFSVCGFLFGFLWARMYLRHWFLDADRDLATKLSRYQRDGQALGLTLQHLSGDAAASVATREQLASSYAQASLAARDEILLLARGTSADTDADNYAVKNPRAIDVLEALTQRDTGPQSHRLRAELAYAYDRQQPPNLEEAIKQLDWAIANRKKLGLLGWRYYEFRRALDRIRLDANSRQARPLDDATRGAILADLDVAARDDQFPRWLRSHNAAMRQWIDRNASGRFPASGDASVDNSGS